MALAGSGWPGPQPAHFAQQPLPRHPPHARTRLLPLQGKERFLRLPRPSAPPSATSSPLGRASEALQGSPPCELGPLGSEVSQTHRVLPCSLVQARDPGELLRVLARGQSGRSLPDASR